MTSPGPIRREIRVQSDVARAFELFTGHIGKWWPLDDYSVYKGTVAFEGMEVIERLGDSASVWAEVTEWNPPHSLALAWHPGRQSEEATDVRVTFAADGDQTLVSLVHDGWERMPDPAAAAEEYGSGWLGVLARYAALVEAE
jgi:uncharacterized protein YndB with AHSA1/START domain